MAAESDVRGINLDDVLKPFHERATESEARLSRLEAAVASKDSRSEELSKLVNDLESKLEKSRKDKERLETENGKLKYRIAHLVRSLETV